MNWKTTESWSRGQMVEEMFGELLAQRDPDYRRSTRKEQFAHIDYHSSLGTMDVKARKRMSRKSKKLQDEFTWLEFRNVRGNIGWLCSGSDIIAFERKQDFVLIDRHRCFSALQRVILESKSQTISHLHVTSNIVSTSSNS